MRKILLLFLFVVGLGFALSSFQGLAAQGQYDSIILDFREDVSTAQITKAIQDIAEKSNQQAALNSIYSLEDHVYVVKGNQELLNQLRKSPLRKDTEYIEPNYIYHQFETPNDPEYTKQWNLRSINMEQAWDDSKGDDVVVAVIDTGVTVVPDMKQTKFVSGYDFVNDRTEAIDDVGHGTHVAGTIAQSTNNGYGVAGVAYKATIMPIKVLGADGGGTIADIAEGIRFAADNGAGVINMSLGGGGESQLMMDAINYAHDKGVVIVAAAGNSNENASSYPARYPHVIGVSATDSAGEKAPYSNYGAGVDISAPGGSDSGKIIQNTIDPATGETVFEGFQGTSMAAPHVAGVAALIKAAGKNEPDEVLQILKQSSRPVENDAFNYYGAGHLDAGSAVKLALKGQITFKDFFRWLRDSGYLNPRFWIDGGAVALLPKIAMVLGSYIFAWFLRNYLVFSMSLNTGMILGSSGLFFLRGFYVFDLPQWPFRVMGSSIPELGNTIQGTGILNPAFASVLIPFILIAVLLNTKNIRWFAIGTCLGVASCLAVSAALSTPVWGLGVGVLSQVFLGVNALLCLGLAYLSSKVA